jgi:hypothetical protein
MGGGLLQLVAYGAQDVYLTGNPQITFFKVVYRRHTNFAIESIEQTFNGNPGYGNRVTCQISRNGDLIHRMYLAVKQGTNGSDGCGYFGLRLIDYVELEIGGQKIDKQYSHWMYIWNELSLPRGKRDGYYKMINREGTAGSEELYIPLEFWFCRNVGLALPLIALQYHEVKVNILFQTEAKCAKNGTNGPLLDSASLWVDYIFLDTDERRRFAQLSHEYLIEQLQFTGAEAVSGTQAKPKLSFNHPCKELYWFVTADYDSGQSLTNQNWFNYTKTPHSGNATTVELALDTTTTRGVTSINAISTAKLVLNGNDRFSERPGSYFNLIQPFQHHENVPSNRGINVYSFALKPEEHQPSGTLNMSRIDTAALNLTLDLASTATSSLNVYAVNYNVLRILSGMGGLAYSN